MSSSVKTTRRVTVESSVPRFNAKDYGGGHFAYTPKSSARSTSFVSRTPAFGGSQTVSRSVSYGFGAGVGPAAGSYAAVSGHQVVDVRNSREKEKKDMQDLNERFANYIEKVRFLEAQNKKLADELGSLKQRWGKETASIKLMFTTELDCSRKLFDDAEKEKARFELKCRTLEDQLEEKDNELGQLKELLATQDEDISEKDKRICQLDAEANMLRANLEKITAQNLKYKADLARLNALLNSTRCDLDAESLAHVAADQRCQSLEEQLEFLNGIHEQELKELAALAYRDSTAENREFWKNEMGLALHEIQEAYDEKLGTMREELEQFYQLKVQEFRTGSTRHGMEAEHAKEESKRLRTQLADLRAKLADLEARNTMNEKELELLRREYEEREREWESERNGLKTEVAKLRAEMESILKELQELMDTKLGLELEIAAYRKLLEGEESRSSGFRGVIDSIITRGGADDDSAMRMSQVLKGEMSARTTYQRSAKGPISVSECAPNGAYIILENTGKKEEKIDGWSIIRELDGDKKVTYTFGEHTLKPEEKVKIYSYNVKKDVGDKMPVLVTNEGTNWSYGQDVTTRLINLSNEERATHVQKTLYSS